MKHTILIIHISLVSALTEPTHSIQGVKGESCGGDEDGDGGQSKKGVCHIKFIKIKVMLPENGDGLQMKTK